MDRWIGVVGIAVILLFAVLLSYSPKKINIRTVASGLILQMLIGVVLLKWETGNLFMQWVAGKVTSFLNLGYQGSHFLFGNIVDPQHFGTFGFQFAFSVLPTIIFFASFMSFLYYLGVMQHVVKAFAWLMQKIMGTSGAESLSCSANVFLGQTEAPLLVRPFLPGATKSELCAIMVGGFGTIAGSVMAGYIQMGVPAAHIIIASCMAAPGSLMIAKIILPETEKSETLGSVHMPKLNVGSNVLDAISHGTTDGLHLALNVAAMLVAFIALIAFADKVLLNFDHWIDGSLVKGVQMANGEFAGYFPGSLKTLFGSILAPIVWLMGVPQADLNTVGGLLGIKLAANEFVAYANLSPMIKSGLISSKAGIMATYMLCGFANFASIGIQIGGISALAPNRRSDLAKLAFRAMLGGALVSCMTATIAGLLL
ncbi:MAG: NupC/NupG family nucleoside CNT transporter [Deltaproteobacteria bacterium CG11_big_fil_rev_8_21_14_0_20_47_16]|nr:MAG: NupC/NupG family nucleoside CNT transporter [Deltaproteobacteria bacterium CG11_big_fil_rev_8_21_14_0_20_47_16]